MYAPGGSDGGRAIALGQAQANDSTLLPSDFRGALGLADGEVPDRTAVKLGPEELEAFRYENLQPEGADRQVTVYARRRREGVATVACLAPPADAAAFKPRLRRRRRTRSRSRPASRSRSGPTRTTPRRWARRSARSTPRSPRGAARSRATARSSATRPRPRATSGRVRRRREAPAQRVMSPANRAINRALARGSPP